MAPEVPVKITGTYYNIELLNLDLQSQEMKLEVEVLMGWQDHR